uniref:Uncharacterized protein n=1 Tax=Anguilla anguilla TaxID=7936 RepID=A0A0E9XLK7_ANGAN
MTLLCINPSWSFCSFNFFMALEAPFDLLPSTLMYKPPISLTFSPGLILVDNLMRSLLLLLKRIESSASSSSSPSSSTNSSSSSSSISLDSSPTTALSSPIFS